MPQMPQFHSLELAAYFYMNGSTALSLPSKNRLDFFCMGVELREKLHWVIIVVDCIANNISPLQIGYALLHSVNAAYHRMIACHL